MAERADAPLFVQFDPCECDSSSTRRTHGCCDATAVALPPCQLATPSSTPATSRSSRRVQCAVGFVVALIWPDAACNLDWPRYDGDAGLMISPMICLF